MRISAVKTFLCNCYRTNWVFVKIETDTGPCGWGEATLEYREPTIAAAIHDLESWLIGRDPANIELFRHDCYRDAYWRYSVMYIYAYRAIMASPCTRGLFYHKNQMSLWEVTEVATMENIYRDIAEDFHKEFTEEDLRITAYLDLGARRRMYREYLTDSSFLPIDRYCYYHVYHMGLLARLDEATITRDIQDAFAFADAHTPPTVPILCGQP